MSKIICITLRRLLVGLVAALASGAVAGPAAALEGKALLIGIDQYQHVRPLVGSARDVETMRRFAVERWRLREPDIKVVLDHAATRSGILDALDQWLVAGTRPGELALLYYSGHGAWVPDLDGDEGADPPGAGRDEVLVGVGGWRREDGQIEDAVLDDEIGQRLALLRDRIVVVIIDSCHSGTISRGQVEEPGAGGITKTPEFERARITKGGLERPRASDPTDGVGPAIVFTAAAAHELAQVNLEIASRQGVFTEAFLRGAAGAADANGNGLRSLKEMVDFTRTEAASYCGRNSCQTGMTPTLEAPDGWLRRDLLTFAEAPTVPSAVADTLGSSAVGPVAVAITPSGPVPIGKEIQIEVTTPISGNLVVLDLPPDDQATLLFPNGFSEQAKRGRRVRAGEKLRLPDRYDGFALPASGPAGKGSVVALVIDDPVPLEMLEPLLRPLSGPGRSQRGFAPVADPLSFLGQIGKELILPWTDRLTTRGVRWAIGHYDYEIIAR